MSTIKPMETADEIDGKGYVHYKSWQEAYSTFAGFCGSRQISIVLMRSMICPFTELRM